MTHAKYTAVFKSENPLLTRAVLKSNNTTNTMPLCNFSRLAYILPTKMRDVMGHPPHPNYAPFLRTLS